MITFACTKKSNFAASTKIATLASYSLAVLIIYLSYLPTLTLAQSQCLQWTEVPAVGAIPLARWGIRLTHDLNGEFNFVWGGKTNTAGTSFTDTTYTFEDAPPNDNLWTEDTRTRPSGIGNRSHYVAVYNDSRGDIIIDGGIDGLSIYNDTVLWDGDGGWFFESISGGPPPARWQHAGTWHSSLQRMIIFGGASDTSGTTLLDEVWEFECISVFCNWFGPFTPATRPAARRDANFVYDPSTGSSYLFGGTGASGQLFDVWSWDSIGQVWTPLSGQDLPVSEPGMNVVLDPIRDVFVLFASDSGRTYEWDRSAWTLVGNNPGVARRFSGMTYDAVDQRILMFGGISSNSSNIFANLFEANISTTDSDADGTADCLDLCPLDPLKVVPGLCNCGVADTDTDVDGTPDCLDLCPADPLKIALGVCGCGVADTDTDGDGTADCLDACPLDPLKTAVGICGCGLPETDDDGDGTPNCIDTCPTDPLKVAPGICGCGVQETDSDGDGILDCQILEPQSATLDFFTNPNGLLSGSATLDRFQNANCAATIFGRTSDVNNADLGPIVVLASDRKLEDTEFFFSARDLPRVDQLGRVLHMIAQVTCVSGTSFRSNVAARRISQCGCLVDGSLDIRDWEQLLRRNFRETARLRGKKISVRKAKRACLKKSKRR